MIVNETHVAITSFTPTDIYVYMYVCIYACVCILFDQRKKNSFKNNFTYFGKVKDEKLLFNEDYFHLDWRK